MPIIITGIHRSGTTLVSKIIEDNNVFLGKYKDINNESVFFQNINKWLMSINSSSWDNPSSFLESINTENFKLNLDKLKLILHSKMNVQYFGMNNIIFNKKFDNIKNQWGWKDPRNIFTLPFWLKLFPKTRIYKLLSNWEEPKIWNTLATAMKPHARLYEELKLQAKKRVNTKKGLWQRSSFTSNELKDKIFGLIGFGAIGKKVCKLAQSFCAKVIFRFTVTTSVILFPSL